MYGRAVKSRHHFRHETYCSAAQLARLIIQGVVETFYLSSTVCQCDDSVAGGVFGSSVMVRYAVKVTKLQTPVLEKGPCACVFARIGT